LIRPDYYNCDKKIEPIRVIQNWDMNFSLGNVIKYIFRAGSKPGASRLEDLEKAKTYLEFEIEEEREREAEECEE